MQATNHGGTDFKTDPTHGNGNGHKTTGSFSKATSVRPSNNQVVDIILKMHRDLFEFGRERAKKSSDIKPD